AGQPDEAERSFRRARDLADSNPDTWVALILFLTRADAKKAEAELEQAKARLPKGQLPLVLAPCYEALGRREQAGEQYQLALAAKPGDPQVLRTAAAFYAHTGQPAKAAPLLRQLIDPQTKAPDTTVAWARRALASALSVTGNYHQFREALALVDANGGTAVEDKLT